MYTKFKECLLKPSRINNYLKDSFSKTILYFLLLLFIFVLPQIVSLFNVSEMPSTYADVFVDEFSTKEKINYQIKEENGKTSLVCLENEAKDQIINIGTLALSGQAVNLYCLFTYSENPTIELQDEVLISLIFVFNKNNVIINVFNPSTSETIKFASYSYEKLGITSLNFSIAKTNKMVFRNELNQAYREVYYKNLALILLISIPSVIIGGAINLLLNVLILALLIKLIYGKLNVKFGEVCKIVLLASTPRVVFNLLSIIWSNPILYFIGEIITIVYIFIALRYYFFKFITLELVNKNQNNEEGDDDDEL